MNKLLKHIEKLTANAPERPALLVCTEDGAVKRTLTRKELLHGVTNAAAHIAGLGLRAGERVALDFGNSIELLIISWAAWSMGIITVPLDTNRDTGELRNYKIRTSGAKFILQEDALSTPVELTEKVSWAPGVEHEALILFTSGTTARPKGAQLTLNNLIVNAVSINEWLQVREDDRFLVQLPLHHINSTTFCLSALLAGASIVIPPRYSNSRFWSQVAQSGATYTSIVPSIVFDQLSRVAGFNKVKDLLMLTRIQLGSAPVIASAAEEFMQQFHIPLYQGYGQTETALRVTGMPMDLQREQYETLVAENSIGTPMSWAEVQIADENGTVLGEKEDGELIVKGPAVMKGYVANESAFRDGYFLTGDIGYYKTIAGRRFFFLKGRKKEILIKGGVNISPVAVENALLKISVYIDQVYVVGVSDERYGEEVGAVIVWKSDVVPEDAMRRLKIQLLLGTPELSKYESPQFLTALLLSELPTTSTGKVQRTILKSAIGREQWEPLHDVLKTSEYHFTFLTPQSSFVEASYALYNHCWQPLTLDHAAYATYLRAHLTLVAIDTYGTLQGQISFSYKDNIVTCVSICSATFKPKSVPAIVETQSPEEVREYLLAGHDPVMNFHTKMGAELVEVILNGRPEDKSSLGYTMLLRYPPTEKNVITSNSSVATQLIEVVRLFGKDMDAQVFALSRPGGLAAYLNREL